MAKKLLKDLLEEINEAAPGELDPMADGGGKAPAPTKAPSLDLGDDDDEEKEEKLTDHAPDGKGHYTPDDLREIIDYVNDLLDKEKDKSDSDDGDDEDSDDIGEIGLDLIYEYADLLPETVINQIVDDLKDMFEIEDTMLESIISEGSAFFTKASSSPAAAAARKVMRSSYKKNKAKIKKRNGKWRNSEIGKKIAALHKKIMKGVGKLKGKRVVAKG
jgi:hypothetical protein